MTPTLLDDFEGVQDFSGGRPPPPGARLRLSTGLRRGSRRVPAALGLERQIEEESCQKKE